MFTFYKEKTFCKAVNDIMLPNKSLLVVAKSKVLKFCLFSQHHHRKPVGLFGLELPNATETDGFHLRLLDAVVDELLGDVAGTGNAQCAVTLGGSSGFVGSTCDVDGQMMLLGILGNLC